MALVPRGRVKPERRKTGALMRWDVLNEILSVTEQRRFLEIGVQSGVCGQRVHASEKCGVDPKPANGAPKKYRHFHRGTSDSFFEKLDPSQQFDAVLVDGLHHADQVLTDVENALRHLSEDGFIVLHDCNPQSELVQRVPRQSGVWNGDCWKAMAALRSRPDLDAFTIDSDHGIGVVRRRRNASPLQCDDPMGLTYEQLCENREQLLGLVPADRWQRRAGHPLDVGSITVVTAIFGGRDKPIAAPSNDVDRYVMFTDGDGADGWDVRHVETEGDPRRAARRHKALALDMVDGDVVVWVDGRIEVTAKPLRSVLRESLKRADIASFPHPWRACAYAEARECADLGRADEAELLSQVSSYRGEGFPEGSGLWNTMVVARRRTSQMVQLGRAWWEELESRTLRDQVSLPYLLWKFDIECGKLGADVYRDGSNEHFIRGKHARAL